MNKHTLQQNSKQSEGYMTNNTVISPQKPQGTSFSDKLTEVNNNILRKRVMSSNEPTFLQRSQQVQQTQQIQYSQQKSEQPYFHTNVSQENCNQSMIDSIDGQQSVSKHNDIPCHDQNNNGEDNCDYYDDDYDDYDNHSGLTNHANNMLEYRNQLSMNIRDLELKQAFLIGYNQGLEQNPIYNGKVNPNTVIAYDMHSLEKNGKYFCYGDNRNAHKSAVSSVNVVNVPNIQHKQIQDSQKCLQQVHVSEIDERNTYICDLKNRINNAKIKYGQTENNKDYMTVLNLEAELRQFENQIRK